MIYCPNCGTSNRKGSRFCNECGEPLPSTGMRCPMCDTINAVGNVYCQKCNARLVPMSSEPEEEESEEKTRPIKGFSLPTIPLDETAGEQEKPTVESIEQEESTSEDWLDELRESTNQQPEIVEDDEHIEDDEEPLEPANIPDWLSDLGSISEESPRQTSMEASPPDRTPEEATPEPAEIPDWLRDLGPISEETSPIPEDEPPRMQEPFGDERETDRSETEEPDLEEMPRWLQDISPLDEETTAPSELSEAAERESEIGDAESAAIEIPDWLKEAQASAGPQPSEELTAGKELLVPDEPERTEAAAEIPPPEPAEIPAWLQEAEAQPEETSEEPVSPFTEAPPETIETPDWLTELMTPTQEDDDASPFPAELDVTEEDWSADLERADIPDWLQELRPSQDEGEEPVQGPLETEGLLRGLRGLIPAAHAIGAPDTFAGPPAPQTSEANLARAELLQSLLGQPAIQPTIRPKRGVRRKATDTASLAERWLVAGFLILAVLSMLLAPLVTGMGTILTQPLTTPGVTNLHRVVDELDVGDHVLVAFDYGPPEADELSAVAQPVLTHVLERGAQISIASTRPDGPLVARAMMAKIADSRDQYTFIGYRPGTATAVSQLLGTADGSPRLLLILTSRPTPLRLWIEQANARYGDQLPVVAVGSAALEPVASPYLDANAGQLEGAIHGLKGAAAYEARRGTVGSATQRLDALAAGHIAIVVLMIVGALVHALGRTKGEET